MDIIFKKGIDGKTHVFFDKNEQITPEGIANPEHQFAVKNLVEKAEEKSDEFKKIEKENQENLTNALPDLFKKK